MFKANIVAYNAQVDASRQDVVNPSMTPSAIRSKHRDRAAKSSLSSDYTLAGHFRLLELVNYDPHSPPR